jgi:hypothetical protein
MRPKSPNPKNVVVAVRLTTSQNQKLVKYAKAQKLRKAVAMENIIVQFLNTLDND